MLISKLIFKGYKLKKGRTMSRVQEIKKLFYLREVPKPAPLFPFPDLKKKIIFGKHKSIGTFSITQRGIETPFDTIRRLKRMTASRIRLRTFEEALSAKKESTTDAFQQTIYLSKQPPKAAIYQKYSEKLEKYFLFVGRFQFLFKLG
jgi:hypothetical protein